MKSKELKYNSNKLKPRENLCSLVKGIDYAKKVSLIENLPAKTDFKEIDLGNGFHELVRNKYSF